MLNILFMGTPDFAKESLEALYNAGHRIAAVITAPDKPKGRGMKMILNPVKEYSLEKGFTMYQPETLRDNKEIQNIIEEINPDVICVVSYGKFLPEEVLNIPKHGSVNVHPSLLPKYRGSTPIQSSIINGDKETGVTTMYLNKEMDAGDIILQKKVHIEKDETSGELWDRLSKIGASLLVETLEQIEQGKAPRIKQGNNFTVAPMLNKEMAKIDWENKTAIEIRNLVRGLNPFMCAYSTLHGKKIKFWKVDILSIEEFVEKYKEFEDYECRFKDIEPGTIIYIDKKIGMYIKAKDKIIVALEVQGENAKKMTAPEFLRGNKLQVVDKFE